MPSEVQLSDVLSEFARTMLTDFPIQGILDHLVKRIVEVLPVTAAGVTLISPNLGPRYVAASDESALCYEKLQTELGEGPCLVAYRTGRAVAVADLQAENRFPRFTSRAVEAGLGAVFTFPLHSDDQRLGALDLYRRTPGALDAAAMAASQTLADVTSAYLINAQARSDLRESSEQSREKSLHDPLTGLPNRMLLLERLDHAVLRGRRSGKLAAVLFLDLDSFKRVNDTYGHKVGDDLLVAVSHRLTKGLRSGDTLARLSGDEFVILCEDIDGPSHVEAIAARLGAAVAAPFFLGGTKLEVTASVGIAFSGRGDQLSTGLLEEADMAMYQAKRKGGGRHQLIDLREERLVAERPTLERDLRGARIRGELKNAYQPIVGTAAGQITGVEALVRWSHPLRGLVAPSLLIPLAERVGLINEIGTAVLDEACADSRRWPLSAGSEGIPISVNVSALQLMAPDFKATVLVALSERGTDPGLLTLEVTEDIFVQDSDRALVVLRELKSLGVRLALDDFGTGYSSLNYLKRFPVDVVKIDQSLVAEMALDAASSAIIAAVVDVAHTLGMTVVAEGVETAGQREQLASLGCDYCQGYYFARPMFAGEMDRLVEGSTAVGAVYLPIAACAG
jgi:diguanylate cyclase (GGDEF)-like protein